MQLLDSKLGIGNIMEFHNQSKTSSLTIEELLPSMNRSTVRIQESSNFPLELSLITAERILNVDDYLTFVSGGSSGR